MERFSLSDIKVKNRIDIFHYIYNNPCSSKQKIANQLGITLPTVTQHLTALMEDQLVEKSGQLNSTCGRKATSYSIISTARIAIGIELTEHTVHIAAVDLYVVKKAKVKINLKFERTEAYFETLRNHVLAFIEKYHFKNEQILGIGIGIQGLVSQGGRRITYATVIDVEGLSIDIFEKYFSWPCRFIHNTDCAANSELWVNPEINDAIYLSLCMHLGGALILNRQIKEGITGKSGIFEHMTLIPGGRPCYCGRTGCAECYCSASTFLDDQMDLDDFFQQKAQGNSDYQKRWEEFLYYLAILINNLHMVLESTVILGGDIIPYLTDKDLKMLQDKVVEFSAFGDAPTYILPGKCRNDAVAIGAALPFIQEFLQNFIEES